MMGVTRGILYDASKRRCAYKVFCARRSPSGQEQKGRTFFLNYERAHLKLQFDV
jgi:hypothetical protein